MLKLVSSIIFIIALTVLGCKRPLDNNLKRYQTEIFPKYKNVYSAAQDSIYYWIENNLENSAMESILGFKIDSLIIFNESKTKLLGTSLSQDKSTKSDCIKKLCGSNINGKWYFYFGASYVIMREGYQDSIYSPLTFSELSYIAHKEILSDAIIQNPDGTFSSNEKFFKDYFDKSRWAADSCTTQASFDSLIVYRAGEKYKHKLDKLEIERIKLEMQNSVRPPEPPGLWFRKLFSTKPFQ